jgi:hypothetical protein
MLAAFGVRRDPERHVELMRRSRENSRARKLRKLGLDDTVEMPADPFVDPVSGQPLMICHVCGTTLDPDTGNCACSE